MTAGTPPSGYPPPRQSSGASAVLKVLLGVALGGVALLVGCGVLLVALVPGETPPGGA